MMKTFFTKFGILIFLVCIATLAQAYTTPTGPNTTGPFTEGTTTDTKNSDFSIGKTFQATGASGFTQNLIVLGQLNGGHPADTGATTISIGSTVRIMSAQITGFLQTKKIQADSLKPVTLPSNKKYIQVTTSAGAVVNRVCADTNTGTLELCTQTCGNGVVEGTEQCDAGAQNGHNNYCSGSCTNTSYCGTTYQSCLYGSTVTGNSITFGTGLNSSGQASQFQYCTYNWSCVPPYNTTTGTSASTELCNPISQPAPGSDINSC